MLNYILTLFYNIQTFRRRIPKWLRKSKIVKKASKVLVNHLGLTLSREDLQNVVDLMEPHGEISDGIELLNPPLDVSALIISWILIVYNLLFCFVSF